MIYLEKYKGKTTRHDCPGCGAKLSFTLYINGDTNEPIHKTVGKCNRESKCGYHYTPKQYFMDNPMSKSFSMLTIQKAISFNATTVEKRSTPSPLERAGGEVSFSFVQKSASYRSNFVRFLCEFMTTDQIQFIGELYALGATKNKEVIFWQIDLNGKVRTGKIMQYNPETGKRIKHESGAIDWVHNKLKHSKQLPDDFNLQQCFFGEHLLRLYPDSNVAIVESEKSAIIASVIMPDLIWLAAGGIQGLTVEKYQVLKNRNVTLFPDLRAYKKWTEKAKEIESQCHCVISVSTVLENISTPEAKSNGLDIADYIISELKSNKTRPEIQSFFSPTFQTLIERNKALLVLINGLQLEEV